MTSATPLPPTPSQDDIHQAGLEVLHCEPGPAGMVRFLRQFDKGSGDYTAERARLQAGMTVEDVVAAMQKVRAGREQARKPLVRRTRPGTMAVDASGEEARARGMEALRRELGPRAFVLFLQQFIKPSGDYTAERAELHAGTTMQDVIAAIEKMQAETDQARHL